MIQNKQWQGLPSMEAVLNTLKHAENPGTRALIQTTKSAIFMLLLVTRPGGIKSI